VTAAGGAAIIRAVLAFLRGPRAAAIFARRARRARRGFAILAPGRPPGRGNPGA
jgi:hypothetical protein